jgi:hypothetical protein
MLANRYSTDTLAYHMCAQTSAAAHGSIMILHCRLDCYARHAVTGGTISLFGCYHQQALAAYDVVILDVHMPKVRS